ncbi:MAG: hypothetical protein N3A57_08245, partial [Negativicutes bacterium]|nr:hypothetical protein [Negativicutes bacterium]
MRHTCMSIAIVVPSYRRKHDLMRLLDSTKLPGNSRFVVVANYPGRDLEQLKKKYAAVAVIIDEKNYRRRLGPVRAWNVGIETARNAGFEVVIGANDDIVFADEYWAEIIEHTFASGEVGLGVLAHNDRHSNDYGWSICGIPEHEYPDGNFPVFVC